MHTPELATIALASPSWAQSALLGTNVDNSSNFLVAAEGRIREMNNCFLLFAGLLFTFSRHCAAQNRLLHFAEEYIQDSPHTPCSSENKLAAIHFSEYAAHDPHFPCNKTTQHIALLPFANISANQAYDWLAITLPASVRADLHRTQGHLFTVHGKDEMGAVPRGEGAFLLPPRQVSALGRLYSYDILITGSYGINGERITISLQVFNTADGYVNSSLCIEGDMRAPWEVMNALSLRCAALLGIPLSDGEKKRISIAPTRSAAAFVSLCRGRRAPEGTHLRIAHLQKAIEEDPECVEAHYLLGATYQRIGESYGYVEWFNKAIEEYRSVLAISPRCAEGHCALGMVYMLNGKKNSARRAFEKALALDPCMEGAETALRRLDKR